MYDLINKILFYAKVILLLIVFSITLYILFLMQASYGNRILTIASVFIPLFLVLIAFVVSFFFQEGNRDTLFNVSCFIAFVAIAVIDFRTILDKNMVLSIENEVNFYFFENQLLQIKILSYLIFFGNAILIYKEKKKKNDIEVL